MQLLTQIVYQASTSLLAPVLVSLLTLLGWTLFVLGGFLHEWRSRRRRSPEWLQRSVSAWAGASRHCRPDGVSQVESAASEATRRHDAAVNAKLLAELELAATARLAWLSFGVRMGPLLGLMGTLIPMGPALQGITAGNVKTLAGNLVIVFSTTVLGVLIGGLCYAMLLVRRQWYARDLAAAEHWLNAPRAETLSSAGGEYDEARAYG